MLELEVPNMKAIKSIHINHKFEIHLQQLSNKVSTYKGLF